MAHRRPLSGRGRSPQAGTTTTVIAPGTSIQGNQGWWLATACARAMDRPGTDLASVSMSPIVTARLAAASESSARPCARSSDSASFPPAAGIGCTTVSPDCGGRVADSTPEPMLPVVPAPTWYDSALMAAPDGGTAP